MVFPAISSVNGLVMEGADARRFAQTQFAGDVDALAPGHWQWNAWLNAKGRVQALMHLVDIGDDRLLAVLRGGDAEATRVALVRYLLRMRANLTVQTFTGRHGGPVPDGIARMDAGQIVLGYGLRSLRLDPVPAPSDPAAETAWRLADIRQGWPKLPGGEPAFLPPALGLEHLGAVAFEKGCYPGQEIAARLHYRGGHKHCLYHLCGTAPLPEGGIRDADGGSPVWILDSAAESDGVEALAVASNENSHEIKVMDNIYSIVTKFHP